MKFYFKLFILFFSILFLTKNSTAQKHSITGKVLDEAGNPVAYASIIFKGSAKGGTWTTQDGSYKTFVPKGSDTLVCSHISYIKKSESIEGNNIINIVLDKQVTYPSTVAIVGTHKYSIEELAMLENNKNEEFIEDNNGFSKIEINALFAGGQIAFERFLRNTIVYPDSATISIVNGIVKVGFTIDKDGLLKNISLLKGVNRFTDQAVIQAIKKAPKWIPAVQNGRNVEQYKEVSVSFDIKAVK